LVCAPIGHAQLDQRVTRLGAFAAGTPFLGLGVVVIAALDAATVSLTTLALLGAAIVLTVAMAALVAVAVYGMAAGACEDER